MTDEEKKKVVEKVKEKLNGKKEEEELNEKNDKNDKNDKKKEEKKPKKKEEKKPKKKPKKKKAMDMVIRIAERTIAKRGLQINRKDKDQMSDTGGSSKGRLREPDFKPSREDSIKTERRKNKTPSDRDPDNDNDPDQGN